MYFEKITSVIIQYENHIAAILNDPDFPDSYSLNKIYSFEFSCKYASPNWKTLRDGGLLKSKFLWLKFEGTIFHLQQQKKTDKALLTQSCIVLSVKTSSIFLALQIARAVFSFFPVISL